MTIKFQFTKEYAEPAPDFSQIQNISDRKKAFFTYIYQHSLPVNQSIKKQRNKILTLSEKPSWSSSDVRFLERIAAQYHLGYNKHSFAEMLTNEEKQQLFINRLLLRVDQIPPALILAQAANESAWGTSRFATEANNYFGIWCFTKGCGLVPKSRGAGERHEVKYFDSTEDSISYYVKLLNTHNTYKGMRQIRAAQRQDTGTVTAVRIVKGLEKYSSRGTAYIKELNEMIRYNRLGERYPLNKKVKLSGE